MFLISCQSNNRVEEKESNPIETTADSIPNIPDVNTNHDSTISSYNSNWKSTVRGGKGIYSSKIIDNSFDIKKIDTCCLEVLIDTKNNFELFSVLSKLNNLKVLRLDMLRPKIQCNLNGIGKLNNIEYLWVGGANYDDLNYLGELEYLKYIHFEFPQFNSFHHNFWNLQSLQKLSFMILKTDEIPEGIENLISLETLSFTKSRIGIVSPSISHLKNFKYLVLNFSQINSFPSSIENSKSFSNIILSHSRIDNLSNIVESLKNIKYYSDYSTLYDNKKSLNESDITRLKEINPTCIIKVEK